MTKDTTKLSEKNPALQFRDPAELRLHPLLQALPAPVKDSAEWFSFVDAQDEAGPEHTPPIFITAERFVIWDDRRWRAARQLQWDRLACLERPEAEAAAVIVDALLGERSLSRGAKLYLLLGLMPEFVKSATARRLANLRRGAQTAKKPLIFPKSNGLTSETVAGFCERLGVSREMYARAVELRELLHNPDCRAYLEIYRRHPGAHAPALAVLRQLQVDFREELEPRLFSGEGRINLWNAVSYIGGSLPGIQQGCEEGKNLSQLELFTDGLAALARSGKHWARFDDEKQNQALEAWRETAAALPADLRGRMAVILEELS